MTEMVKVSREQILFNKKIGTVLSLIDYIVHYKPVLSGEKEAERLRHYREVINEDLTYITEYLIRG